MTRCKSGRRSGALIPGAVIDGLPTSTIRGRGRPKLRWLDNVTKWSGRTVGELRRAVAEREQAMAATEATMGASLCRMLMMHRDFLLC